jgi:hypothetical protein
VSEDIKEVDELAKLKNRAKFLGVKYSPNIGVEKLTEKLDAKIDEIDHVVRIGSANPVLADGPVPNESKAERKVRLRREAARLVRVRVTCMNPNKRDWEGEIYSVGNSLVGFHKKYVPFNADEGWHIPNIIYKHLKDRKCQVFHTVKGPRGAKIRKGKLVPELSIELMPDLTADAIQELAQRQAQANNLD